MPSNSNVYVLPGQQTAGELREMCRRFRLQPAADYRGNLVLEAKRQRATAYLNERGKSLLDGGLKGVYAPAADHEPRNEREAYDALAANVPSAA